jgi:hypothetical protein
MTMKIKFLLPALFFGIVSISSARQKTTWNKWDWLMGEWKGEGFGQSGQGSGTFSFSFDLDRNIIIRKSHCEYPATQSKPSIIHDDLMIVYLNVTGSPGKAIYFDNEGHTISYIITYSEKSIVMTSDKIPDTPVFRLVYTLLDRETINTRFEMSQDGDKFMPYIEGKARKSELPDLVILGQLCLPYINI